MTLRRVILWALLLFGLALILLVAVGVGAAALAMSNADAALGWIGGILDQLAPVVSTVRKLTGE